MEKLKREPVAGTLMGQVLAVRIKDIYGDMERSEVYGSIVVEDADGPLTIYKKEADEIEHIHRGGTLILAQPCRPMYATKDITICMDLKDANGKEFINESHLVSLASSGEDDASLVASINELFDRNRSVDFEGEMGVATVYYCLLQVAIPVLIGAKFEFLSGFDSVRVSGTLIARYRERFNHGEDDVAKEHSRVVMFSKKSDEAIVVNKDFKDHLFETHVVVPVYSSLILEANFECVYTDSDSNETKDTIRDSKVFAIQEIQIKYESFKGKYDEIKYRVFFLPPKFPGTGPI